MLQEEAGNNVRSTLVLDPSLVPATGDAGKEEDYARIDAKKPPSTPNEELAMTERKVAEEV